MKKFTKGASLALAVIMLASSVVSCGPRPGGGDTGATTASQTDPPSAPGNSGTGPAPEEPYNVADAASGELLASFTEYPDGSYLTDARFETDGFLPEFDLDPAFDVTDLAHNIAADEDNIYVCKRDPESREGETRLYRADKKTGEVSPLCAVPGCAHDGEGCGAYICGGDENVFALRVYDGALYWLQQGRKLKLVRESADGAERTTVFENDHSVADGVAISSLFIHRGVAYASGTKEIQKKVNGKYSDFTVGVVTAFPLDGGEAYNVLSADPGWDSFYGLLVRPMGNDLYIMLQGSDGKDLDRGEWGVEYSILYRWSAATRKAELLFAESCADFGKSPETHDILPVSGDGVYFQDLTEYKREDGAWASRAGLRKYSFKTGKVESVTDALSYEGNDFFVWMTFSGGHIAGPCLSDDIAGKVCFFDLEGGALFSADLISALKYKSTSDKDPIKSSYDHILETYLGDDGSFVYYYVRTINVTSSGSEAFTTEAFYLAVPVGAEASSDGAIRFDIYPEE